MSEKSISEKDIQEAKANYIKRGGNACYMCGSTNIEGGSVEIDSGMAKQSEWCNHCEHEWEDNYTLTSVTE